METTINCAEACVNGCVLGDKCPHREYANKAEDFISNTSLDSMLAIADESRSQKTDGTPSMGHS
jgi:hypothetical protein